MRSGDHNGTNEIHWVVYTFPWRQLESTMGVCPFHVACGTFMWLGGTLKKIVQHLKKKKKKDFVCDGWLFVCAKLA